MARVAIALGSNVGDGAAQVGRAALALGQVLLDLEISPLYRTAPMYVRDQPAFVNAAAIGHTELSPRALLKWLKRIERDLGRIERARYGPREIDLDLIGYGALAYSFVQDSVTILEIPHARVGERRFVLRPLADLAPDLVLPGLGCVDELLRRAPGSEEDVVPLVSARENALGQDQRDEIVDWLRGDL